MLQHYNARKIAGLFTDSVKLKSFAFCRRNNLNILNDGIEVLAFI